MITLGDDLDVSAIWGHDLEIHHETFDLSTKTHLLGLNGYPRFTTDVTYYIFNKTLPVSVSGLTPSLPFEVSYAWIENHHGQLIKKYLGISIPQKLISRNF